MKAILLLVLLVACHATVGPTPTDPYAVGFIDDSLTAASRLSLAPVWDLYIVIVGADSAHSGIAAQGQLTPTEQPPRFPDCLRTAGQNVGERQLEYVALGDTLASDSLAFGTLTGQLGGGQDSLLALMDSAIAGHVARVPGLVAFSTGLFNPTTSTLGRGATPETPIIRRWRWTDSAVTFAEVDTSARADLCIH